jgi:hypothetical protein
MEKADPIVQARAPEFSFIDFERLVHARRAGHALCGERETGYLSEADFENADATTDADSVEHYSVLSMATFSYQHIANIFHNRGLAAGFVAFEQVRFQPLTVADCSYHATTKVEFGGLPYTA